MMTLGRRAAGRLAIVMPNGQVTMAWAVRNWFDGRSIETIPDLRGDHARASSRCRQAGFPGKTKDFEHFPRLMSHSRLC